MGIVPVRAFAATATGEIPTMTLLEVHLVGAVLRQKLPQVSAVAAALLRALLGRVSALGDIAGMDARRGRASSRLMEG
jgi:hypothetical protein